LSKLQQRRPPLRNGGHGQGQLPLAGAIHNGGGCTSAQPIPLSNFLCSRPPATTWSCPRHPQLPLAGAIRNSNQEEGRLAGAIQEEGRQEEGRPAGAIGYSPSSQGTILGYPLYQT